MGLKLLTLTIGIIAVIYQFRTIINTPYDWVLLLAYILLASFLIPDDKGERFWALFKWTWLK